jgi:hypothetical protein
MNNEQVINYGSTKLLLVNGTAHKLDSRASMNWARAWFTKNWELIKMIGGQPHLGSLAIVNKAAADFFANSDYRGKREVLAAIADGKMNKELGVAA